jgi:hypothetical protein
MLRFVLGGSQRLGIGLGRTWDCEVAWSGISFRKIII